MPSRLIKSLSLGLAAGIALFFWQEKRKIAPVQKKPHVTVTVFVHGSLLSGLALLNPRSVWDDQLEDTAYFEVVSRARKHRLLRQDQILLDEDLHEIPQTMIDAVMNGTIAVHDAQYAAYVLAAAYDTCATHVANTHDRKYFAFGHLGLLSQKYRKQAAAMLYSRLCAVKSAMSVHYDRVEMIVIAHSHGGNIALNLAHHEDELCNGLGVDALVMLGTPIQHETARYVSHPMFGMVLNCFSAGDIVQRVDFMSTAHRKSHQSLLEQSLVSLHKDEARFFDVQLMVNGVDSVVDHANMWMIGRSHPFCTALDPLPFVVFIPYVLSLIEHMPLSVRHLAVNMCYTASTCSLECRAITHEHATTFTPNMALLKNMRDMVTRYWKPEDTSRRAAFSYKEARVMYDAFVQLRAADKEAQAS
jgi:hypothetical protein